MLSLNAGRVSAYEPLLRQVSGKEEGRDAKNALRTLVKSLRRKLGDDAPRAGLDPHRARRRLPHAPPAGR